MLKEASIKKLYESLQTLNENNTSFGLKYKLPTSGRIAEISFYRDGNHYIGVNSLHGLGFTPSFSMKKVKLSMNVLKVVFDSLDSLDKEFEDSMNEAKRVNIVNQLIAHEIETIERK